MDWLLKHLNRVFPGLVIAVPFLEYVGKRLSGDDPGFSALMWFVVGYMATWPLGNLWDGLLFDPLFSVSDSRAGRAKRLWWGVMIPFRWLVKRSPIHHELTENRINARDALLKLNVERQIGLAEFDGVHGTTQALSAQTKRWKEDIGNWLEGSKFLRTLALPLLVLLIHRLARPDAPWPFESSGLSLMWSWHFVLSALVVTLLLMLYMRARYMAKLYAQFAGEDKLSLAVDAVKGNVMVSLPMELDDLPFFRKKGRSGKLVT
jgi:hypothetical protein